MILYQVLLVEDEDIIRQGLQHMIVKMDLPLVICEACNGTQALQICQTKQIDILLTDISMPSMDGLALIAALRQQGSSLRCIIISGYSEFAYAQRAIRYGVEDYLVKPIDRVSLHKALQKAITELKDVQAQSDYFAQKQKEVYAKLQQDFWIGAMNEQYHGSLLQEKQKEASIDIGNDFLVVVGMYNPQGALYEALLTTECTHATLLCTYTASYGYLFHLLQIPQTSIIRLQEAYLALASIPSCGIITVMSHPASNSSALSQRFKQAIHALDERLLTPLSAVQIANERISTSELMVSIAYWKNVDVALEANDSSRTSSAINAFFDCLLAMKGLTPALLVEAVHSLETYVLTNQSTTKIQLSSNRQKFSSLEYLLSASTSLQSFQEAVAMRLQTLRNMKAGTSAHSSIDIVMQYIEKYYANDISVVYCSNLISMNASYFSTYFKKNVGMSFTNYLHQVRIRKSMELLKEGNLKIYEISQQVGFVDDKYFCRIFKDACGVTPSEYRSSSSVEARSAVSSPPVSEILSSNSK